MATLMMLLLVVAYAWSTWLLKRQEHFDETAGHTRRRRWRAHTGMGTRRR